jgi:hypothetical protein
MNHAMVLFFGCKYYFHVDRRRSRSSAAGAVSIIGFSFTAFVRQILIYDPAFIFPVSLQQVTLYRTIHKGSDAQANRQMRVCANLILHVIWLVLMALGLRVHLHRRIRVAGR